MRRYSLDEIEKGKRPKIPESIPDNWKNMILCCWSQDPNKRPDFTSICCSLESNQFVNNEIDEKAFS